MFKFFLFIAGTLAVLANFSVADLPPGYQSLTAQEKLNVLWRQVSATPYAWAGIPNKDPGALELAGLFLPTFDKVSFTHESDEMPQGRKKLIHTYGSAVKVELRIFPNSTFTGIFQSGGIGIARMSLAKQDYNNFTPGMGLKILVDGKRSQNLQVMFSLDGQAKNHNFFENKFWNIVAEPTTLAVKLMAKAFALAIQLLSFFANDKPESERNLGLYEQSSVTSQGAVVTKVVAPYLVTFTPNPAIGWSSSNNDDVRVNLNKVPAGSLLYTISAKRLQDSADVVIGQLVSSSGFVASAYGDEKLFFQHASKRWRA